MKFYTRDWLARTLDLSFEERGFYLELLVRMWDQQGPLPDDEAWLAASLRCNPRTVRKLISALVAHGKITRADGQITNERMEKEIAKHSSRRIRPEFEPNSSRIQVEFEPNATKNSTKSTNDAAASRARAMRAFHIPDKEKENIPPPRAVVSSAERAREVTHDEDRIEGVGWVIDLKAVDMAAALIGLDRERGRQLAEILARDWSANGIKPRNPMAMVRAALIDHQHRGASHAAAIGRADKRADKSEEMLARLRAAVATPQPREAVQ